MKKSFSAFLLIIGFSVSLTAQNQSIPDVELKTVDGTPIMSSDILDADGVTVLFFWDSESGKCCDNLEVLQSTLEDDLQQADVKMVAVCTDCHGSWNHIKPMANGKNWEFDIYIDTNDELKRSLGISNIPSSMLYDKDKNLVCRQSGFGDGNEEIICETITQNLETSNQLTEVK